MSIPLVSNVGFTEITQSLVDSNSGVLNDIAGTTKSKLPLQYFKLNENISGNLTMNNDSAHKKIILDTDGKTLFNTNGSPLTQNSSINLELKGSGDVQSKLKTSTLAQTDSSHTGTTTFTNSDSSTIAVTNEDTDISVEKYIDRTFTVPQGGSQITINVRGTDVDAGTTTLGGSTSGASTIFRGPSSYYFNFSGGTSFFIGDTSQSSSSPSSFNYRLNLNFAANDVSSLGMHENANISAGQYPNLGFSGQSSGHNRYSGIQNERDHTLVFGGLSSGQTLSRRLWYRFERAGNDRKFVFTNNLNIECVLSGADPFDGATVAGNGGTETVTTSNSTDGTYNITMTVSGNDGSSHPYALAKFNNGTGTVDLTTQGYTGTRSSDGAID